MSMQLTLQCEATLKSPQEANALMELKFVNHETHEIDNRTEILPAQIDFEDIDNCVLCLKININKTDSEDAELAWLSTNFAKVAEKIIVEEDLNFFKYRFIAKRNIVIPEENVDILAEITAKTLSYDEIFTRGHSLVELLFLNPKLARKHVKKCLKSIKKNQFTYMSINNVMGKRAVVKINDEKLHTQHQFRVQCEVTLTSPKEANELMKELKFVSNETAELPNYDGGYQIDIDPDTPIVPRDTKILPATIEFEDTHKYVLCVKININKTDPADEEPAWLSANLERFAETLTSGLIRSREQILQSRSQSIFGAVYLDFTDRVDRILVDLPTAINFTTDDSDWLQSIKKNQFTYMCVNNVIGNRAVVKINDQKAYTQHASDCVVIPDFAPNLGASRCFACKKRIRVLL